MATQGAALRTRKFSEENLTKDFYVLLAANLLYSFGVSVAKISFALAAKPAMP